MKILLVTSHGGWCGIAAHSAELKQAVEAADPTIDVVPSCATVPAPQGLDPVFVRAIAASVNADVVHLNYHFGLHSQWTPEVITAWREIAPVIVTLHDTRGECPPDERTEAIYEAASAMIVHEPCQGLPNAKYWRMGVPELTAYEADVVASPFSRVRPVVGTVGHDFPWKGWDELATTAAAQGWGLLIYTPEMTDEHEIALREKNPWLTVRRGESAEKVLAGLSTCDATAFCFGTANTGQSASILQGIAARKPVIAFEDCRQMRGLKADPMGGRAISWCRDWEEVGQTLRIMRVGGWDCGIVALSEQESWRGLGAKYAALFREVAR